MIPWHVDPNWYQRYWLEEHPGSVQALIGIAKRILRLFRPVRIGGSASVHAGVPSSRDHIDAMVASPSDEPDQAIPASILRSQARRCCAQRIATARVVTTA